MPDISFTQLPREFNREPRFDSRQPRSQGVIDDDRTIRSLSDDTGTHGVIDREFRALVTSDDRAQYRRVLGATADTRPNTLQVGQGHLRVTWQRVPVDGGTADLRGEHTRSLEDACKLPATCLQLTCMRFATGTYQLPFPQSLPRCAFLLEVAGPGGLGGTHARRLDLGDLLRGVLLNGSNLVFRFFFEATHEV